MLLLLPLLQFLLLLVVFLLELLKLLLLPLLQLLLSSINLLLSLVHLWWPLIDLRRPLIDLLLSLVNLWWPLIDLLLPLIDLLRSLVHLLLPSLVNLWRPLINLLLPARIVLFLLLALLHLLLFDSLAFLVLSRAHVLQLLLMFLLELRVDVAGIIRARIRRTVVVDPPIAAAPVPVFRSIVWPVRLAWRIYVARRSLAIALRRVLPHHRRVLRGGLVRHVYIARRALPIGIALLVWPVVSHILRWSLADRRRHSNVGPLDLRVFPLDPAHLGDCRRPSAIFPDNFLLLDERCRSRRRRHLGDHWTAHNRTRRSNTRCTATSQHAALLRRYGRSQRSHRSRSHFTFIHTDHVAAHIPCGNESVM